MCAASLEHPRQVHHHIHAAKLGRTDHAEQGRPAVTALGAAREQARVPELRVALEVPLARVVVERDLSVVDEPGEVIEVVELELGGLPEAVGLEWISPHDAGQPDLESSEHPPRPVPPELHEGVANEASVARQVLEFVMLGHRGFEHAVAPLQ